ncbi:hypothetical protein ACEUBB_17160 [Aeromonas rivipollensis]|uniref:hypothetical protein n=1 Tax=Aeromonas rivipollensis TaxID=948519 RepID=UPI0038D050C4
MNDVFSCSMNPTKMDCETYMAAHERLLGISQARSLGDAMLYEIEEECGILMWRSGTCIVWREGSIWNYVPTVSPEWWVGAIDDCAWFVYEEPWTHDFPSNCDMPLDTWLDYALSTIKNSHANRPQRRKFLGLF